MHSLLDIQQYLSSGLGIFDERNRQYQAKVHPFFNHGCVPVLDYPSGPGTIQDCVYRWIDLLRGDAILRLRFLPGPPNQ